MPQSYLEYELTPESADKGFSSLTGLSQLLRSRRSGRKLADRSNLRDDVAHPVTIGSNVEDRRRKVGGPLAEVGGTDLAERREHRTRCSAFGTVPGGGP